MLKSPHGTFYMHIQILLDDYTGEGEQAITRLKYQCANLNFSDQSRYNIVFQHEIKTGVEPEINYAKRFQSFRALTISVINRHS